MIEHRVEPGMPHHMGFGLGGCELQVFEHYGDATPGSPLRIPIDDVDANASELRAERFGSGRPRKPKPSSWGTIEMTITDPAGNLLAFYSDATKA